MFSAHFEVLCFGNVLEHHQSVANGPDIGRIGSTEENNVSDHFQSFFLAAFSVRPLVP